MRNKTLYVNDFQEIDICGHKMLSFDGGVFEKPYNIKRAEGEHNMENCEGCRKHHKNLIEWIKLNQEYFPNCCEGHKKAKQLKVFNISDFTGLENIIADKIMFTYQHFINHFENDDYFEDFTNYFDYVVESFGCFPNGFGSPFQMNSFQTYLTDLISNQKSVLSSDKISKIEINSRIQKVIQFIDNSFIPVDEKTTSDKNRDMNLLFTTYDKWYKTFPFDLPYFQHLKDKYSKTMPIIEGKPVYNKYSGLTKSRLVTKDRLTESLVNLTKDIISKINGLILFNKGLLTDVENLKLSLILKNRELELTEFSKIDYSDRKGYIIALKSWFKSEKKFIEEIKPYLNDTKIKKVEKNKLTISQIALKLCYEGVIVTRNNCNELIKPYGHKSGEKLYNEFTLFSSVTNRKGNPDPPTKKKFQNKIKLFESVIELLDEDKKKRANDELTIILSNYNTLHQ